MRRGDEQPPSDRSLGPDEPHGRGGPAIAVLDATKACYPGLGLSLKPQLNDENAACVVISDTIVVLALQRDRFADVLAGPVARALRSGGKPWLDKMEMGPMDGHSITDPDGHVREVLSMGQGA
ncbi:hypothetical protein [uncultured Friedmanniella sp.]|uniref:hypothetical protein n=1 Tax=uncultured Friedmanniella sp. TaxID=335381 RepID=UPI0035CA0F46